jgi:hypothetical protein
MVMIDDMVDAMIDEIQKFINEQEKGLLHEQFTYMRRVDDISNDDTIAYLDGRMDAMRLISDKISQCYRDKCSL